MSTLRSNTGNAFERAARSEKVNALVEAIDAHARHSKVHPYSDAARIAKLVTFFKREHWVTLCERARVNLPSETTISAILRVYERRAAAVAEEQVA